MPRFKRRRPQVAAAGANVCDGKRRLFTRCRGGPSPSIGLLNRVNGLRGNRINAMASRYSVRPPIAPTNSRISQRDQQLEPLRAGLALEGMMNTRRNRGPVSKRLGLSVWNSETTRLSNQRLLERLEAENAQLRRNVVDLMLEIQALRDGSAKTRLHDANSGWMEFSERTPNYLSGCSSRPVTPKIFVSGQLLRA